ncbi:TonB-dependent receptor [Edaphobacter aggregans]|uniref:TonB-dependent receptor n=1 Tax=Edaphobacter aggregans TaxID=570835 RepID=UPI000689E9C2|nr:carboxypeptidase regulatory-like domain-containing protein [Edaphobacter aggregans]
MLFPEPTGPHPVKWRSVLLSLYLLLTSAQAWCQFDQGVVLGTLRDTGGLPISGAKVTLTNTATGTSQTVTCKDDGTYVFPTVRIGSYTVTAESAGFSPSKTDVFNLSIGSRQEVNLTLKAGGENQTVTVTGAAELLETSTSDNGQVIGSKQIVNLPLNGRNYADLALLVPGVRRSSIAVAGILSREGAFDVNGLNSMANNFLLDGLDNNAYQTANQGYSNEAMVPSPDAVQEFKVQTDNYSAEFGRAAGSIVNVSTRSGTNQFHGVAYDYLRNTVLNAYGPFLGNGIKPTLIQNQFGGTLGGPIKHDKLFFFADYEGLRHIDRAIQSAVVPTAQQRQGIFTNADGSPIPLINPVTGASYANGVIPASDQSAFATAVMAALPMPNVAGATPGQSNYTSQPANTVTSDKGDIRGDYYLGPKNTFFARYSQLHQQIFSAPNIQGLAGGNSNGTLYSYVKQVAGGWTYNIHPNSILEVRLGLTWTQSGKNPYNLGANNLVAGFQNIPTDPTIVGGVNTQSVTGFSQFGRQATNPQFTNPHLYNPKVNYSTIRGRHSLKFGYEYGYIAQSISDFHPQFGADTYAGQFSRASGAQGSTAILQQAYNLADFLVGARSHYELNNLATITYLRRQHFAYAQDDWHVNDKLTLNLGLRYELVTPYWEKDNHLANFDPTSNSLVQASSGSLYKRALLNTKTLNFAPRVGFAYQVRRSTVIRAGYAISYAPFYRFGGEGTLSYNGPFIVDATVDQTPQFGPGAASKPLPNCTAQSAPLSCFRTTQQGYVDNFATAANFSTLQAQTRYIPKDDPTAYVQTTYVNVQQEITPTLSLGIGYLNNHGSHIRVLGDFNQAATQSPACANNPAACLTLQQRRPINNFTNILETFGGGFLQYNALQVKLEKRYSQGLRILNSFTWSRAINNASADLESQNGDSQNVNIRNIRGDRGPSGYNQPLNDTLSALWDLPFGTGRRFGSDAPRAVREVLGGWQLSAISTATSGLPINLTYSPTSNQTVSSTSGVYSYRPNLTGSLQSVSNPHSAYRKTNTALLNTLNASALSIPTVDQPFGNVGRNALRGPSFYQLDLGLHKQFGLWSDSSNLEFRLEGFNVLNKTNFASPDSNRSDGGNFGAYTASNVYPSRQVQLALRLSF